MLSSQSAVPSFSIPFKSFFSFCLFVVFISLSSSLFYTDSESFCNHFDFQLQIAKTRKKYKKKKTKTPEIT